MIKRIFNNNFFQSAIAQFGSSGIAIVSFMILARTLSQESFGEWGLFLALTSFIDLLKSGLVGTALVKYSSGASEHKKNALMGSSWVINLFTIGVIAIINYSLFLLDLFTTESIVLFLVLYPIYALISLPYHYYLWHHQIEIQMKKITILKMLNAILFLGVTIWSIYAKFNLQQLVLCYLSTFGVSSIVALISKSSGISKIKMADKKNIRKIIQYGRFHILAFLGSSLLRNSDVFLISYFLGPEVLAIYLIPQRLWVLVVMPIASAISIGFPLLSASHNSGNIKELKLNIERLIGALTLFYIPFALILFCFAQPLVTLVGGKVHCSYCHISNLLGL